MATTNKSETKKSGTKKTDNKKASDKKADSSAGAANDFPKVYMRLRTVLDALEIGALQYVLKEASEEDRIKRAEDVEGWLLDTIARLKKKTSKPPYTSCADGYYNCGGVCVPYQCPTDR